MSNLSQTSTLHMTFSDERYVLLVGPRYSVGRQDSDITIPADKSISRKHAFLTVTHPESNVVCTN